MRKLKTRFDLDGICADLHTPWLALYNKLYKDTLTIENLTTFDIDQVVKRECGRDIYKLLTPELYRSLRPIPGAAEALRKIRKMGHEVRIVTSSAADPDTAGAKLAWTKDWLNISRRDVFVCHDKHDIKGDVSVEDSPDNLKIYKVANPEAFTITIEYPYNKAAIVHGWVDFNAGSYRHPREAWEQIVEKIDELGRR